MSDVEQAMHPLPAHCLGWFGLGYHISDVIGRDACIAELLLRARVAAPELCVASTVRPVLARLLTSHASWITAQQQGLAAVSPVTAGSSMHDSLAASIQEWVPAVVAGCCGKPLTRWKVLPATFLTLARGGRCGNAVCLK